MKIRTSVADRSRHWPTQIRCPIAVIEIDDNYIGMRSRQGLVLLGRQHWEGGARTARKRQRLLRRV